MNNIERKDKLYDYLSKAGLDNAEYEKYMESEYRASKELGMDEEDSKARAITSTANYYRRYLDKLGNRVKFLCLGFSRKTDYGLSKKVSEIRKEWSNSMMDDMKKQSMIDDGKISALGRPLHTKNTTNFVEKHGTEINMNEEVSQLMVGVVENSDGKTFPAIIRANGMKACNEKKVMYTWCLISGEQGSSSRYPRHAILNSRDLRMKEVNGSKRITMEEYLKILDTYFKENTCDGNDKESLEKINVTENGVYLFMKNMRMMDYDFSASGARTCLTSQASVDEFTSPIVAEAMIGPQMDINVDPKIPDPMILLVQPFIKKDVDPRTRVDILGMFTDNPIERKHLVVADDFFAEDVERPTRPSIKKAGDASDDFFNN